MKNFTGCGVALVTPMKASGDIDYEALARLIEFVIANGVNFVVPTGTTGESPTLSHEEQRAIIAFVVRCADGRVPVMAGTGSNSTQEAIALTQDAFEVGANGVLVVSPYYNKPEPSGMCDYYEKVAEVGLPVCLYDIPGRTGRGVPPPLVCELAHEGIIESMKWADGDFDNLRYILQNVPEDFTILSGDDANTLEAMRLGAQGVISVIANIYPQETSDFLMKCADASQLREGGEAQRTHDALVDVMNALFTETNPQPVKTALEILYNCEYGGAYFRSPIMPMTTENHAKLEAVLRKH